MSGSCCYRNPLPSPGSLLQLRDDRLEASSDLMALGHPVVPSLGVLSSSRPCLLHPQSLKGLSFPNLLLEPWENVGKAELRIAPTEGKLAMCPTLNVAWFVLSWADDYSVHELWER